MRFLLGDIASAKGRHPRRPAGIPERCTKFTGTLVSGGADCVSEGRLVEQPALIYGGVLLPTPT